MLRELRMLGFLVYIYVVCCDSACMSETYDQLKKLLLEKSVRTGDCTLASGKKSDL